jgi:hypothetical protein
MIARKTRSKNMHFSDNDPDAAIRKKAVSWLGQSNDPKALDYLTKLITSVNR